MEVKVEGDKVEIISDSGVKNTHQIYILGKECDDPLPTEHIAKVSINLILANNHSNCILVYYIYTYVYLHIVRALLRLKATKSWSTRNARN